MTTNKQRKEKIKFSDFDKLNLQDFAENLITNIEKGTTSSIGEIEAWTISLNAEFGNGKTTFLKMFQHFIEDEKKDKYNVIFINAWKSDFYGKPIIAILSKLVEHITEKGIKTKIIKLIGKFIQSGTTILIEQAIKQHINEEVWYYIKKRLKDVKSVGKKKNDIVIKELNQMKVAIEELKDTIKKYTKNKKLIIIVDELDRTRPDYAVHFLEDIKHFFDIENVVFLVGVNRQQMEATVKCLYGQTLNFEGYYRKFFKQEIDLPDPYKEAQKLVDDLVKNTTVKFSKHREDRKYRISDCYLSCKIFKLTLREIETFIRIFELILGSKNKVESWVEMNCYSFFICLYLKEKEEFKKILSESEAYTFENFKEFVSKKGFNYNYEDESREKFNLNCLLGQVATSLIDIQVGLLFIDKNENFQEDKTKIENEFNGVPDVKRLFYYEDPLKGTMIKGFSSIQGQPALNICNNINSLKSTFKE